MAKDLTTEDTESTELQKCIIQNAKDSLCGIYSSKDVAYRHSNRLEKLCKTLLHDRERWREIAGRLALACIADVGDFREEVLQDYRKLLEEAGE